MFKHVNTLWKDDLSVLRKQPTCNIRFYTFTSVTQDIAGINE